MLETVGRVMVGGEGQPGKASADGPDHHSLRSPMCETSIKASRDQGVLYLGVQV